MVEHLLRQQEREMGGQFRGRVDERLKIASAAFSAQVALVTFALRTVLPWPFPIL